MPSESLEEFLLGRSICGAVRPPQQVKTQGLFQGHRRNDETCLLCCRPGPRVKAEMAALNGRLAAPSCRWLPSWSLLAWRQNEKWMG